MAVVLLGFSWACAGPTRADEWLEATLALTERSSGAGTSGTSPSVPISPDRETPPSPTTNSHMRYWPPTSAAYASGSVRDSRSSFRTRRLATKRSDGADSHRSIVTSCAVGTGGCRSWGSWSSACSFDQKHTPNLPLAWPCPLGHEPEGGRRPHLWRGPDPCAGQPGRAPPRRGLASAVRRCRRRRPQGAAPPARHRAPPGVCTRPRHPCRNLRGARHAPRGSHEPSPNGPVRWSPTHFGSA